MGGKNSNLKEDKNLQKNGEIGNNESDDFVYSNNIPINLTNDIIISQSNKKPSDDYKAISFLGEGSSSTVYCVKNLITGSKRAMKVINKNENFSEKDDKKILNEINILKTLDHPNILKIFEIYISNESYSMIMELCQEGELYQEILFKGPFKENYSAYVMFQILSAINYCHGMKIIHRDLKTENILISEKDENGFPRIKIADFGTPEIFKKNRNQDQIIHSYYYMAPESIDENYIEKSNLWSCGVIMYLLLSGKFPFIGDNNQEIIESIKEGEYDLESSPFNELSKSGLDLIKKLLKKKPKERISVKEALNHQWFKENKSQELYNKINDNSVLNKMINNLKIYKRNSIIQEIALVYLVHNFPQMKDVVNACKFFNQIDLNCNGKITKDELFKFLKSKISSNNLKKDVDEIFQNIDMDNNGFIEYEEFVRAAVSKEQFMDTRIIQFAFRYFDKDGTGQITYKMIEEVFKESVSDKNKVHEALKQIIGEVDTNGDGIISFDEFSNIMKKMLKS